jgi:hypothetical protein
MHILSNQFWVGTVLPHHCNLLVLPSAAGVWVHRPRRKSRLKIAEKYSRNPGAKVQDFKMFAWVNLFIGKNHSGKPKMNSEKKVKKLLRIFVKKLCIFPYACENAN